jgi:hypothetical protein
VETLGADGPEQLTRETARRKARRSALAWVLLSVHLVLSGWLLVVLSLLGSTAAGRGLGLAGILLLLLCGVGLLRAAERKGSGGLWTVGVLCILAGILLVLAGIGLAPPFWRNVGLLGLLAFVVDRPIARRARRRIQAQRKLGAAIHEGIRDEAEHSTLGRSQS